MKIIIRFIKIVFVIVLWFLTPLEALVYLLRYIVTGIKFPDCPLFIIMADKIFDN